GRTLIQRTWNCHWQALWAVGGNLWPLATATRSTLAPANGRDGARSLWDEFAVCNGIWPGWRSAVVGWAAPPEVTARERVRPNGSAGALVAAPAGGRVPSSCSCP